MSDPPSELREQFRRSLRDCKGLYIQAARAALENQPDADEAARREMIRRMVDLHKGLLMKVYCAVAGADSRWSRAEQELASDLVDHLWQMPVDGPRLKEIAMRMFRDAAQLDWYSLVRPFDRIHRIRDLVPDLETVVMRLANLIAKADGTVATREAQVVASVQAEIELHLRRIPLDDAPPPDAARTDVSEDRAIEIIHREPTLLKNSTVETRAGETRTGALRTAAPRAGDLRAGESAQPGTDSSEHLAPQLADSLDQALHDLNALIGLEPVKKEITTLTNFLKLQHHRREAGLPAQDLTLHMVYSGNPGTGKTTVARIVGRILKSLGFLGKGHLVETDRSGLVAEYAGQTGPKTNRKINDALDGILFIDEAYSLASSQHKDAYGLEAIQALVKRMEDDRKRLVVILAGYPEPMEELLRSNPGLGSRFNTQLSFDDYSPVDLARIFDRMCRANHYELPAASRAKLLVGFDWLYQCRDEHFGNGRLVRNTFENSVRRLANRVATLVPVTRELLTVLTPQDVTFSDVPGDAWSMLEQPELRFMLPCPSCHRPVHVRARQLGQRVGCPHCKSPHEAEWGELVRTAGSQ